MNEVARAVNDLRDEFHGLGYDIRSITVYSGRRIEARRADGDGPFCLVGTADEVREALTAEAARRKPRS